MDNELLELCKEVYEKTGWLDVQHPIYTSDYLLEKLPTIVDVEYVLELFPVMLGKQWRAGYSDDDGIGRYQQYADTPLKALLKLTIALHEAKELKV